MTNKWTDERTQYLIGEEGYQAVLAGDRTLEDLAKDLNVSVRSVIGKLVSEKMYVKAEKPKTRKELGVVEGPSKKDMLKEIEALGFDVEGFLPARKDAIERLKTLVMQHKKI